MGNAASNPTMSTIEQKIVPNNECPINNDRSVSAVSSSSSTGTVQTAKCPISGQESKDGMTCAYDPTKMSFWQPKPARLTIPAVQQATESEICPMRAKPNGTESNKANPVSSFVTVAADKYKNPTQYNVYSQKIDPTNQMPAAANQQPASNQSGLLDTTRVTSTIPKAGSDDGAWVYPSPQMFWNALVRKGKTDGASEEDMDTVIAIHNNMNETTWRQVISWEALEKQPEGNDKAPKLLRFMGRPDELSPLARFKMFFNHPAPFDRHDWVVDRGGKEVRYIIDYYHDESAVEMDQRPKHLKDVSSMQSIKVDVRPALDSVEALYTRLVMMPFARLLDQTSYKPPSFFPSQEMSSAGEKKNARIMSNWADIKTKCAGNKEALATCDSDESCGAASVALQRCVSSVVCPSIAEDFDSCVSAKPQNDTKTGAAFSSMIKCIELFETDTKQLQQQKQLAGGK